jgi:hypothetical protein
MIKHLIGETIFTLNVLCSTEGQGKDKQKERKKDVRMNMLFHERLMPVYPTSRRNQSVKLCIFVAERLYFSWSKGTYSKGGSLAIDVSWTLPTLKDNEGREKTFALSL